LGQIRTVPDIAGSAGDLAALGVFGAPGDDVDDAVDGVGSPDGGAGAPNDFNPLDAVERDVLGIPKDAGKDWGVNRAAIEQDEEFIRIHSVESPDADSPIAGIDLRDLDARNHAQKIGDIERAGATDVLP